MAITNKPFVKTEKIRRREFGPKPSVYTHVDINQNAEATIIAIEELSKRVGGVSENLTLTINGIALTKPTPTTYKLDWDIDFSSISNSGADPFFFTHKSVRFSTPYTNLASSDTRAYPPKVSFWLKAKQKVVTFALDPVMSGVNGAGFPSAIASSDTIVWEGETLVQVIDGVFPSLSSGEEFICQVASIGYEDTTYLSGAIGYVPYLMWDAPPIDVPADWSSFFEQGQTPNSPDGQNALSTDARQWLKIKEINNKLTYVQQQSINIKDIIDTAVGLALAPTDSRKIIHSFSNTMAVYHILPSSNILNDLEYFTFVNDSTYPTYVVPEFVFTGDYFNSGPLGNTTLISLPSSGDSATFVLDKPNKKWILISYAVSPIPTVKNPFITLVTEPTGDYTNPSFIGGGPGTNNAQYRFNNITNEIEFRGMVLKGTATGSPSITIFVLPVGQRPSQSRYFTVMEITTNTTYNLGISPSGQVRCQIPDNNVISLDTVKFSLD